MTNLVEISKYLSFILRHKPESIGLTLSREGWVSLEDLILASAKHGTKITEEIVREVVKKNDKQRFTISSDTLFIKANQGHSISVDLELREAVPPDLLYHGTVERFLKRIQSEGLLKMKRHHVHLSDSKDKARQVGMRRGKPIILKIAASLMYAEGSRFYVSPNDVWLTDIVPAKYIELDS